MASVRHQPWCLPVRPNRRNRARMTDKPIELSIDVPPVTKQAIECAAAERGMTVADFLEKALRKHLVDAGYIDEEATTH